MAKGEGDYTNGPRFIEAFRKWMKYDDAWVEKWFELGDVLEKADDMESGWKDDDFQGGMA